MSTTPTEPTTALATIETVTTIAAVELFKPGAMEHILGCIEAQAREEAAKLEISTETNRKALASLAYKIARSKTYIDDQGKTLTENARKEIEAVNSERKIARDRLDTLKDEIRQPLTEFEEAEKSRVACHEEALKILADLAEKMPGLHSVADIEERIEKAKNLYSQRKWEEFSQRAAGVYAVAQNALKQCLIEARKLEAERAELKRLKEEEAERTAKAREEAAARAATEAAERKAQEAAALHQREAEREQKRLQILQEEAEARARYEEQKRVAAEQEAKRQAELAESRRVAAEQAAKRREEEAVAQAKRDQEAAIERERQRVAAAEQAEKDAAAKREANKRHVAKINKEAEKAFAKQFTAETAKEIVTLIAAGVIPHVSIEY